MSRRVIFWDTSVSDLLNDKFFGGIAVQLLFWAKEFSKNNWEVFALTREETYVQNDIKFLRYKYFSRVAVVVEWFYVFYYLITVKPQVIILRGAQRILLPLSFLGRLFKTKIVFLGASDVNFQPGKEMIKGDINRKAYRMGLLKTDYIVVQNDFQRKSLMDNYGKDSILIPNIWSVLDNTKSLEISSTIEAIWVGNLRKIKRVEWFVNLARKYPTLSFVAVGGSTGDEDYFNECKALFAQVPNLQYLGSVSFHMSNSLIQKSKILICTSEFEGFPNTFLQAWANHVPVLSTVDPSGVVTQNNLGLVAETEEQLCENLQILTNEETYKKIQISIDEYFNKNHSSSIAYSKLLMFLNL